ncbi:MAG: histidine phosphatase family protein [Gammaproteobacteria bacterium]|nr:histidine phosphatase family protein [Gammaproteobacteria bacterium]
MTWELMLLRHGKSDWSTMAGDFERPLTRRGKRGAKGAGEWLSRIKSIPDHIVSSPARRAWGTARRAAAKMDLGREIIVRDERIYAADVSDLLLVLRGCPDQARRVMLVGHNPGLEDLVEYLADEMVEIPVDGKLMPTATIAWLIIPGGWSRLDAGCAQLRSITRPDAQAGACQTG